MLFEGKTQEEINQIRQELFLKSICILDDSHISLLEEEEKQKLRDGMIHGQRICVDATFNQHLSEFVYISFHILIFPC